MPTETFRDSAACKPESQGEKPQHFQGFDGYQQISPSEMRLEKKPSGQGHSKVQRSNEAKLSYGTWVGSLEARLVSVT